MHLLCDSSKVRKCKVVRILTITLIAKQYSAGADFTGVQPVQVHSALRLEESLRRLVEHSAVTIETLDNVGTRGSALLSLTGFCTSQACNIEAQVWLNPAGHAGPLSSPPLLSTGSLIQRSESLLITGVLG